MHKKIFFIMTVILINKNITSSSSESNRAASSDIIPVIGQIIDPNQGIDSRIRRISSVPTSNQHKENILNSITRILTEPNSGTIESIAIPYRKILFIQPNEAEFIEENVIFEYQNPFLRDPQKEIGTSIWETRENNHPKVQEINNIIMPSFAAIDYFPSISSISSILHCLCTGQLSWDSDQLMYVIFE